jgi:NADH-quinone oxidoreductase subunit J
VSLESISFGIIAALLLASGVASATVKRTFHSVMFLGVFLVGVAALYVLLGSPLIGVIQILVYVGGILTLFIFAVMFVAGDETEEGHVAPTLQPRSTVWSILGALSVAAAALYLAVQFTIPVNRLAAGLLGGAYVDGAWQAGTLAALAGFGAGSAFVAALAVVGLVAWLGIRHAIDRWPTTRILGTGLAAAILGLLASLTLRGGPWSGLMATESSVAQANDLDNVVTALFGPIVLPFLILGVLLTAVMVGALVLARPLRAKPDEENYPEIPREAVLESQKVSEVPK